MGAGKPAVAIIMGSQSDWATMKHAADVLDDFGIQHESLVVSAHRTPERLYDFAKSAREKGLEDDRETMAKRRSGRADARGTQ